MAIGTRNYGTGGGASAAATFTCAYPATIAAGDLLILACYTRSNNASAFALPNAWASSGRAGTVKAVTASANGSYAIFYLVADGTETGNITVNGSASNNTEVAKCLCVPGGSTTFTAGATEDEAAGLTFTNAGVTPPVDGCLVVLVTGFQDHGTGNNDTGFSGWSGGTNLGTWDGSAYGNTSGSDATVGIGTALQTTQAATGNISVNHTDETTDTGTSYSFAITPSVGNPLSDGESDSTTASEVERFRQEADLFLPVETVTATDDAAYTWASASAGASYEDEQIDSTTASDVAASRQRASSTEIDSATATDGAAGLQRHRAGWEDDDTIASETQASRQKGTSSQSDSVTASEQAASQQKATPIELDSVTATDNAAYTWVGGAGAFEDEELESATPTLDVSFALEADLEVPDEIVTPTDVQTARQADASSEVESSSASDNANYAWASSAGTLHLQGQVESLTASDSQLSTQSDKGFESDAAVPTDSWQGYAKATDSQELSATCTELWDFTLAHASLNQDAEVEAMTATDDWAALQASADSQLESVVAIDNAARTQPSPTHRFFVWDGANWV